MVRATSVHRAVFILVPLIAALLPGLAAGSGPISFTDVTATAGVTFQHDTTQTILRQEDICCMDEIPLLGPYAEIVSTWITGGVAAGDYDDDGDFDLFAVGGDNGTSRLFRNNGNGTFTDVAAAAGVAITNERATGAVFADYDGDGDLDLWVGGAISTAPRLFRNDGPGAGGQVTFTDVFATAFPVIDLSCIPNTWGGAFGDYDDDGDLDLFLPHSTTPGGPSVSLLQSQGTCGPSTQHLWSNNGDGTFTDVSVAAGISALFGVSGNPGESVVDQTFSPNFTDLDDDGDLDLVISGDISSSRVLRNEGDGTFFNATNVTINDKTAMGTAVGDYDNDGDFDWFISEIRFDGPDRGNRLFRGLGNATFDEVTETAGVRDGHWGWGSCFADFNNDRYLDIFHVNGFFYPGNPFASTCTPACQPSPFGPPPCSDLCRFTDDPAVLFMSDGDGTFTEQAAALGIADVAEGRGVACFDYDDDGDIDVAISNHRGPFKLYENVGGNTAGGYLKIRLHDAPPNTEGVGTRIVVDSLKPFEPGELVFEIRAGSNFQSANPAVAHVGLGDWTGPFKIKVHWPNGRLTQRVAPHPDMSLDIASPKYRAYQQPTESPQHVSPFKAIAQDTNDDGRTLIVDPSDPDASPLGWHSTETTRYTTLEGNNNHTCADADADNGCDQPETDCGKDINCDFPIFLNQDPSAYTDASLTNLFYWINLFHDIQYVYGFDEVAGNFQESNFGAGGLGGDPLLAEGQDGINCNANISVPPAGSSGRLQIGTCNLTQPTRDCSLDNGVSVHLLGHSVSIRQVGGPSNSSCLNNLQQPGEGWSDWLALVYTAEKDDRGGDPRGLGTYCLGLPPEGTVRELHYSTDNGINPWTYSTIGDTMAPFGVGSRWAQALWEVYWGLVRKHGFSTDLSDLASASGNHRALLYVTEGMQATVCSPSFIDARDGILEAVSSHFGGEDLCTVWKAFAGFGLGTNASTAGPNSLDATDGFKTPKFCSVGDVDPLPTGTPFVPVVNAEYGSHFDARLTYNTDFEAAPDAPQRAAEAALGREVPGLTVAFDPWTGAARTVRGNGPLTAASGAAPRVIAADFVDRRRDLFGLTGADLAGSELAGEVRSASSGATRVHLRQSFQGIPVYQGRILVSVDRDGRVLSAGNAFVRDLARAVNAHRPAVDAAQAILAAASHLEIAAGTAPEVLEVGKGPRQQTRLVHPRDHGRAHVAADPPRRGEVGMELRGADSGR